MDSPEVTDSDAKHVFYCMDWILSILFTLEALLKILVYGFSCGRHAYLKDNWNKLDFFVVVSALFNLVLGELGSRQNLGFLKGFRALRAAGKAARRL